MVRIPPTPLKSGRSNSHTHRDRHAQSGHDVHGGNLRMKFPHLPLKIPRSQAPPEQLLE
jgi:hypothetical protein